MPSENGWEPLHPSADQLEWVTVPGTSVRLQFLKGWASTILRAFAADFNAYVEPLRDADSAAYTATNSVATSNHLNGTAMDLNWNSHRFHISYDGFDAAKIATMRELLAFYEKTVWWGQDWQSPIDCMHLNMGYDTWNQPWVQSFISRKVRADGFSTFRRGNSTPAPVPSTPALSKADTYALATIRAGQKRNISRKGICIALSVPFVESGWQMYANSNVPASLAVPHDAVGSDHDSTGLYQQRQAWGPLSSTMNAELSAGLFFDGGAAGQRGLTDFDFNSDSRTPGQWAQSVQVSAFPDRYQARWADANALYNRLATTVPALDPIEELLMSDLSVESFSIYATPGEPLIPIVRMVQSIDAAGHRELVENAARLGDPDSLARIAKVAAGQGKYRDPSTINHAAAVLADIEATNPAILQAYLKGQS